MFKKLLSKGALILGLTALGAFGVQAAADAGCTFDSTLVCDPGGGGCHSVLKIHCGPGVGGTP